VISRRNKAPLILWSFVYIIVAVAALLPSIRHYARESARRFTWMANHMEELQMVFKIYASESPEKLYPPLASDVEYWVPDAKSLYPEYLSDPAILLDPSATTEDLKSRLQTATEATPPDWKAINDIIGKNFVYIPWALNTPADLDMLTAQGMKLAKNVDGDIKIGEKPFYRLRESVERFFITDINNPAAPYKQQSLIPVLFQRPTKRGAWVLFLNGHVEYLRSDAPWIQALQRFLSAQENIK
jgi:hypothetical protein